MKFKLSAYLVYVFVFSLVLFVVHRYLHHLFMGSALDFVALDATNMVGWALAGLYFLYRGLGVEHQILSKTGVV